MTNSMNIIKYFKYFYLIVIITFAITIFVLNTSSNYYKNIFNNIENNILQYYNNNNLLYVYLTLILIILLRSFGMKDSFNIMNYFITLISKSLIKNNLLQFFFSLIISTILTSLIRLCKYYVIGFEIQKLYSKPINIIFFILRKIFKYIKPNYDLDFLTTKYIIEISKITKNNTKYNLFYYFYKNYTNYNYINYIITFNFSILWIVFIEWIPPFKDLLLYIHNWNFTKINFLILSLSDLINVENFISLLLLNKYLFENKVLESQYLVFLIYFILIFICYISLIPNLIFVKKYYLYLIEKENKEDSIVINIIS